VWFEFISQTSDFVQAHIKPLTFSMSVRHHSLGSSCFKNLQFLNSMKILVLGLLATHSEKWVSLEGKIGHIYCKESSIIFSIFTSIIAHCFPEFLIKHTPKLHLTSSHNCKRILTSEFRLPKALLQHLCCKALINKNKVILLLYNTQNFHILQNHQFCCKVHAYMY